jgi:hypothetical protein
MSRRNDSLRTFITVFITVLSSDQTCSTSASCHDCWKTSSRKVDSVSNAAIVGRNGDKCHHDEHRRGCWKQRLLSDLELIMDATQLELLDMALQSIHLAVNSSRGFSTKKTEDGTIYSALSLHVPMQLQS